jgi:hypothetical protein
MNSQELGHRLIHGVAGLPVAAEGLAHFGEQLITIF